MATPTDITTGAQTVTTTGPVTPTTGLSVATLPAITSPLGSYTLAIEVTNLTAGATARLQLEDTTNAFTGANALAVWDITGQVVSGAQSIKNTWRSYQLPDSKIDVSSGAIRLNVTQLNGTSPSLTVHAWIEI
jgi:hypothetical protein